MSLFHIFIYFPTFPLPAPGFFCLRGRGPRKGENNQTYENKTDLCKAQRRTNEKGIRTKMENRKKHVGFANSMFFPNAFSFGSTKKTAFSYLFFLSSYFSIASSWIFCFVLRGRGARKEEQTGNKGKKHICVRPKEETLKNAVGKQ